MDCKVKGVIHLSRHPDSLQWHTSETVGENKTGFYSKSRIVSSQIQKSSVPKGSFQSTKH